MYHEELLDTLNDKNERVKIINFEKRNLADDRDVFRRIVESFYEYDGKECPDKGCAHCTCCAYKENLDFLCSPLGVESIRVLCDTIFLTGNHITFRELLSLLAHLATMGESCDVRREWEPSESDGFQNIFGLKSDSVSAFLKKKITSISFWQSITFLSSRRHCAALTGNPISHRR